MTQPQQNVKTTSSNSTSKKYSDAWVPIKNISNGMIQLDSNFYVTGVKVEPKNIFILDVNQEDAVIDGFRNLYNTIDYEFWIIIADRPVDVTVYRSQLQVEITKQQNPAIRKLIMQDIEKADQFAGPQYSVVDTEYFILFRDKNVELLQKRVINLMTNLANAGLNSSQVSNADLRGLIDNFYNGSSSVSFGMVTPE